MITIEQYFGDNPYNDELLRNADALLIKVNSLLQEINCNSVTITSGYRSPEHNKAIGGAPNSLHCQAKAIDLADNDRTLGNKIKYNPMFLVKRGMAMESLDYCVMANGNMWVHWQDGLPRSGNTIYIPYAGPIQYK